MRKFAGALIGSLMMVATALGAGLECTSTAAQGSKTVSIQLSQANTLSRMAFGPCNGPPATCRPIQFDRNLRAILESGVLGSYFGENGRQSMSVRLSSFSGASALGVAQVSLGAVGRPMNLDLSCVVR